MVNMKTETFIRLTWIFLIIFASVTGMQKKLKINEKNNSDILEKAVSKFYQSQFKRFQTINIIQTADDKQKNYTQLTLFGNLIKIMTNDLKVLFLKAEYIYPIEQRSTGPALIFLANFKAFEKIEEN